MTTSNQFVGGSAAGNAKVNVLLVGGGGREHAMAIAMRKSPRLGELYTTHPENPGLASLCKPVNVPVSAREIYRLQQFCDKNAIGLVVVGPEDPLAEGFADKLAAPGRKVFGPTAEGAKLEADKAWCKQLLRNASVPMAEGRWFGDIEQAMNFIESRITEDEVLAKLLEEAAMYRDSAERRKFILQRCEKDKACFNSYAMERVDLPVIKATGLAKGKGVILPKSLKEAYKALHDIMVMKVFGDAGRQVVIEERLSGPEVSVLAVTDGRTIAVLPTAQDHKRLKDNDEGPNTGGMGAFSPTPNIDDETMQRIVSEILVPTLDALRREDIDYRGVLFAGVMLTPAGPKVLEFNVRFGDPECQTLLARVKSDVLELMLAAVNGTLEDASLDIATDASCCVVLAAEGYPEKPKAGAVIQGIEHAGTVPGVTVTHAGTKRNPDGAIVVNGGRVLSVTAVGSTAAKAREAAYKAADMITFEGKQMRRDIGAGAK